MSGGGTQNGTGGKGGQTAVATGTINPIKEDWLAHIIPRLKV